MQEIQPDPNRALRRLALATTGLAYVLLLIGSLVSSTGAGLACPDWPLCHGELIPALEGGVVVEYTHRVVAGVVALLVFALAALAWRRERQRRAVPLLAALAVVAVLLQALLGGLTVLWRLPTLVVASHLTLGTGLFASLVWITCLTRRSNAPSSGLPGNPPQAASQRRFRFLAAGTAVATWGQIAIGGYVRHSGAALACPDWPLCRGELVPPLVGLVPVQFLHRTWALVVGLLLIAVFVQAWRKQRARPDLRVATAVGLTLFALQALLGGLVVLTQVALVPATAHLALAAALLGTLVYITVEASRRPSAKARSWPGAAEGMTTP